MNHQYARTLRKNMTGTERVLWSALRYRQIAGCKFRRQVPLGKFIVDFLCYERRLIIEVDGSQHFDNEGDVQRTAWLNSQGFRVLRFWNNEVFKNMEAVKAVIFDACLNFSPPSAANAAPSPVGGR